MKIIDELAVINSVEISGLEEMNEEEKRFLVRLRFTFNSSVIQSKEDKENGVLSAADFQKNGAVVGKSFTTLLDFTAALADKGKFTESAQKEKLKEFSSAYVGKMARFSAFSYTIDELTNGEHKVVNNGERDYGGFSNGYLGKIDDEEAEFLKIKNRLYKNIDDDKMDWGSVNDK